MIQYQLKAKQTEPTTFNLALSAFRIVFMGTPEFAVASLEALLRAGFNIVAVITAPDRTSGRGLKLNESEKICGQKRIKNSAAGKIKEP